MREYGGLCVLVSRLTPLKRASLYLEALAQAEASGYAQSSLAKEKIAIGWKRSPRVWG